MKTNAKSSKKHLDARTFQKPLDELANTIALKVQREGHQRLPKPVFVIVDIYFLLRQAQQTYDLFFFINADECRKKDVNYRVSYSVVILPLVRTMIDCLYNITAILKSPGPKGYQFHESGLKEMLNGLDADERRYGGDQKWDDWIARSRAFLDQNMRATDITEADVRVAKRWPTLSGYLRQKDPALAAHQRFLKNLTFGFWHEYSGMSHATFQGLMPIAAYLAPKDLPHELRPVIEEEGMDNIVALHVARVAGILLCILTEIQAYFRFDGARINERLHAIWKALRIVPEIKELFDGRYRKLMRDKGI